VRRGLLLLALAGCPAPAAMQGPAPAAPGAPAAEPAPVVTADGKIVMPNVVGQSENEAKSILAAAGFQSEPEVNMHMLECDGDVGDGVVKCQSPDAGKPTDPHMLISLNVFHARHRSTSNIYRDQMRPLFGSSLDVVKKKLAELGFHGDIQINESKDLGCKVDTVCDVNPNDFALDSAIQITVGKAQLKISAPPPD
jgi:beta-lactam-binding protein with PASTA domain